jgi:hypothetical protein
MGRSHRRRPFFRPRWVGAIEIDFPLVAWSRELPRTLFESSRIARRNRGRFLHLSRWLARSTDAPFLLGAARGAHSRRISAPSRDRELPKREFPRSFRCLRSPQVFSRVRATQETRSASARAPTPSEGARCCTSSRSTRPPRDDRDDPSGARRGALGSCLLSPRREAARRSYTTRNTTSPSAPGGARAQTDSPTDPQSFERRRAAARSPSPLSHVLGLAHAP